MNSKHNGKIAFCKFIFSILVIGFHLNAINYYNKTNYGFLYGSISVEFFFIVSGYLLTRKALSVEKGKNCGIVTKDFIIGKIKKIFPYLAVGYVIGLVVTLSFYNLSKAEKVNSIFDLFFLQSSGMKYYSMIPIAWYLSTLMISDLLLFPLIYKYRENYTYIVCPIVIFILIGYLSHNYGELTKVETWTGTTTIGMLRGFFGTNIGIMAYTISERIKSINYKLVGKILLTIIETVGIISIFFIIQRENAHAKYDFIMLMIMTISISIMFSEKSLFVNTFNNKFFYRLQQLSLPVFLNQHWVLVGMNNIINNNGFNRNFYLEYAIALVISIVFASLEIIIFNNSKKIIHNIKKCFVYE